MSVVCTNSHCIVVVCIQYHEKPLMLQLLRPMHLLEVSLSLSREEYTPKRYINSNVTVNCEHRLWRVLVLSFKDAISAGNGLNTS
jgi:hypothetical protein